MSPVDVGSASLNDNLLEILWTTTSHLEVVRCLSHPSSNIGKIAADVETHLRAALGKAAHSVSRSASYFG